jgi:hypothetical protein
MNTTSALAPYLLGTTDAKHERLQRQAARLAPFTERLFRDAGIRPGQRVLDVGSRVGDVALLAARLVWPTGGAFAASIPVWVADHRDVPTLGRPHRHGTCAIPGLPGRRFSAAHVATGDADRTRLGDSAVDL